MIKINVSVLLYLICSINISNGQNTSSVHIYDAIKNNEIEALLTGSYNPNRYNIDIDKAGVHYGKCIDLMLINKSDEFKLIDLNVGTSLMPEDTSFQIMYVSKTLKIPVKPNSVSHSSIYAMCGEINKYPPVYGIKYEIGNTVSDSSILKVLKHIENEFLQNIVGQHLLWSVTDNASTSELIKYGADSMTLSKVKEAHEIIFPDNQTKSSSNKLKPAFIKVNKIKFYALITYSIIVSGFMVYAIARTTINKEVSS